MPVSETTWMVARDGVLYGPYTLPQMQDHLASGHIVPTDLAQSSTMREWLLVADLLPASPMQEAPAPPGGSPRLFPDPPDLRWWIALLLGIVTLGAFFVAWDIVEAAWLRRVERSSSALVWYIVAAVIYLAKLPSVGHSIVYNAFGGPLVTTPHSGLITLAGIVVALAARLVFRKELLRHFNQMEAIGLRLNWLLTLLFGGLYFQYHFNRINGTKRALRISVPRG